MANKTNNPSAGKQSLFSKENYMLMLAGLVILAIGFFLMAGGKSTDPGKFDPKEVYSTTRITIAPILIIAGFVIAGILILCCCVCIVLCCCRRHQRR